jgi:hypothetical protein
MIVTFFDDHSARWKSERDLSLGTLADLVRTAMAPAKDKLGWLKFAVFGNTINPKTNSGSLRWDGNVLRLSGILADYDGQVMTPEEAAGRLDKAGVSAIVYTSPSHRDEAPKWRVGCPFSVELEPSDHYRMVSRLNGLLGGILAAESFTLSQSYYFGSVAGNPEHRVVVVDGLQKLDQADELDPTAIGKPNGANGHTHMPGATPEAPIEDIRAALDAIPNPLPSWNPSGPTWVEWNTIGMAIWASSGGAEEGREAFHKWSAKWPAKYDADEVDFHWRNYTRSPPGKIGFGTLVHHAQDAVPGWQPPSQANIVERLNNRFAVVNEAGKVWVVERTEDPQLQRSVLVRYAFSDFRRMFLNRLVALPKGKFVDLGTHWLGHKDRRQYLGGVVFEPKDDVPADRWNLWSGFAVVPRSGGWRLLHEHIDQVLCSGTKCDRDYLLDTIARMVQMPQLPAEVAVVLRGAEGVGKGALCVPLRRLWGQHGIHVTSARQLVGNFNMHLRDCVYLYADEAFFAGDRQHEGVLKALITEPTIPIEGKFQNVVLVRNLLHVWMSSNNEWVVPASHDARRYFLPVVSASRAGDRDYFNKLWGEINGDGMAAMLHDMLTRDVSKFDHRDVPQTAALGEQRRLSLDSLDAWWLEVLDRGFVWVSQHGIDDFGRWTEFVATELLVRSYRQWHRGGWTAARELLAQRMREIYQPTRPNGLHVIGEVPHINQPGDGVVKQDRPRGFAVGTLEAARESFAKKHKFAAGRWDKDDGTTDGDNDDPF